MAVTSWKFLESKRVEKEVWAYAFYDTSLGELDDNTEILTLAWKTPVEQPWKCVLAYVHNEAFGTKLATKPTDEQIDLALDALKKFADKEGR